MATADSLASSASSTEPGAALVAPIAPAETASDLRAAPPLAEVPALLLEAAAMLARLLGAEFAVVAQTMAREESARLWVRRVEPRGVMSEKPPAECLCGLAGSIVGHALRTCNAVMSPNLQADQRFGDEALQQQGVVSGLILPVLCNGEAFAVVGVGRAQSYEFPLSDLWFAERYLEPLGRLVDQVEQRRQGVRADGSLPPSVEESVADELGSETGETHPLPHEGRTSQRRDFPYRQKIASLSGGARPTWDDFFEVRCSDLSGGGISLLCEEPPPFNELVVALGRPPTLTHLAAKVVYVREVVRDAQVMYQVGCRFVGRYYL